KSEGSPARHISRKVGRIAMKALLISSAVVVMRGQSRFARDWTPNVCSSEPTTTQGNGGNTNTNANPGNNGQVTTTTTGPSGALKIGRASGRDRAKNDETATTTKNRAGNWKEQER